MVRSVGDRTFQPWDGLVLLLRGDDTRRGQGAEDVRGDHLDHVLNDISIVEGLARVVDVFHELEQEP